MGTYAPIPQPLLHALEIRQFIAGINYWRDFIAVAASLSAAEAVFDPNR